MLAPGLQQPPPYPPDDHKINWLWFLAYVLFYLLISVLYLIWGHFWNIIFFPLVFFTTTMVYLTYRSFSRSAKINPNLVRFSDLFRGYSHSFFGGGIFALLTELWITTVFVIFISLIFGKSRALQSVMNENFDEAHNYTCNNVLVHLYLAFTSFFVAGLCEEFIKGYLLQYTCKLYLPHTIHLKRQDINTIIWLGICIGLGFGTVEGVIYVCIYGGAQGFFNQLILWLIRAFIAIPFHSITGCLWGIQLSKRECHKQSHLTWIKMGYQQILLHGLYDFIEMEIALDLVCVESPTVTQVLVSIALAILYTVGAAGFAYYQYRQLKKQYNDGAQFIADNDQYQHHAISADA